MAGTRNFHARDRRALTAVLTAGLRHTDIDQILTRHPVPGDPGHDAGKAGRIGLVVATLLANRDHTGLHEALAAADPARITAAGHAPALHKLRAKAGLPPLSPPAPAAPAAPAGAEELEAADSATRPPEPAAPATETTAPAADVEEPAPAAADGEPLDPGWGVVVDGIDPDHPVLAMIRAAGIPTLQTPATPDGPGWLQLRPIASPRARSRRAGTSGRAGGI